MFVNSLIYHSVVLGYQTNTPVKRQWGIIDGYVFILAGDMKDSYGYATQAKNGLRRSSTLAWSRTLEAYCAMEGRRLIISAIQEEIQAFRIKVLQCFPELAKRVESGTLTRRREKKRASLLA